MENLGIVITTLGVLLLLGLAGDLLARRIPVPRVTLLILFGVLIGPSALALLPVQAEAWYPLISNLALLMVGFLLGGKLSLANLREVMAGIAPASAPAAVTNVVEETRAEGRYTETMLGIVAIDDAWGLILFSLLLAVAQVLAAGGDGGALAALQYGGWEVGGALVLGLTVGIPAAYVTGRLNPGQPDRKSVV